MIMDYLLMSYVALASCWPVTLILLSVAVAVLLHAERRVLNVSPLLKKQGTQPDAGRTSRAANTKRFESPRII